MHSAPAPRRIAFLLFDGVKTLDYVGPAEVFVEANQAVRGYDVVLLSPDGHDVMTSLGTTVSVHGAADDAGDFDTVIVPGSEMPPHEFARGPLTDAAAALATRARRVVSICSGAFVLAEIGALDGKRATTHWKFAPELQRRYPRVRVEPDAIFVRDGGVSTSAGVAAGIDLALALVEDDHGADVSRQVAQLLLVYLQRSGGQSQYSVPLRARAQAASIVRRATDLVDADPARAWNVPELAGLVAVSSRHLTRLFREEIGQSPTEYVTGVRFDLARVHLEAGANVTESAAQAGYGSAEALRRAFIARLGISPSQYQRRFRSALPAVRDRPAEGGFELAS
ncbi:MULTISPECIES: GlxA family transcriptional regulator [Microbacterium]|uniref:HTH-type transcriptional regulator CdhR n=1 Tax=Microbacterium trichothecenolyticum TaxID=69370 RepID=A0A0M2H2D8_MICTR|nr:MULTISPECIES: DJ-1/PfpI family protein [Microbacterium]KJL40394.1 HTH-type transcriptional regulator CdhR [Microbacterium trichothecenolyticum]MDR7188325.1 transcriptional regulator GlxA family with amidase domain [Microbacterium sp. BE35]